MNIYASVTVEKWKAIGLSYCSHFYFEYESIGHFDLIPIKHVGARVDHGMSFIDIKYQKCAIICCPCAGSDKKEKLCGTQKELMSWF